MTEDEVLLSLGIARSSKWAAFEHYLLKKYPTCLICGREDVRRNAHHEIPVSYVVPLGRKDLECDERNARNTLCIESDSEHHVLVGHLDLYASWNPYFHHTITLCKGKTAAEIRDLVEFKQAVRSRPKPYSEMTPAERRAMRSLIDQKFPKL